MDYKKKWFSLFVITYFNVIYSSWVEVNIPNHIPKRYSYLCTYRRLPIGSSYAVKFLPKVNTETAERIYLFGCSSPGGSDKYWYCDEASPCADEEGSKHMIYTWSKGIDDVELPSNVGFKLGKGTNLNYVVMQIYYSSRLDTNVEEQQFDVGDDADGDSVDIFLTSSWQKYVAGIYLFSSKGYEITETGQQQFHADIGCQYDATKMAPFAYRSEVNRRTVQAVLVYRVRNGKWTLIANANPQKIQGFYRISGDDMMVIKAGDYLTSSCVYFKDARGRTESCRLYMMYYMLNTDGPFVHYDEGCHTLIQGALKIFNENRKITTSEVSITSRDVTPHAKITRNNGYLHTTPNGVRLGTTRSNVRLSASGNNFNSTRVPNVTLPNIINYSKATTSKSKPNPKIIIDPTSVGPKPNLIDDWTIGNTSIGFICSVGLSKNGDVVALHRGSRNIFADSFDDEHYYTDFEEPIEQDTIVHINAATGEILHSFGNNIFYLPHSLTIDCEGNYWVADIGLHQVVKFSSFNATLPSLILGVALIPGSDDKHFCKPTDVAVDKYGNVFVADGYCNSRIMKFNKKGKLIKKWGSSSQNVYGNNDYFTTPNSLWIDDQQKHLYVSDFRNGRILQFDTEGNFLKVIRDVHVNGKLFAINFNSAYGGVLYTISNVYKESRAIGAIGAIGEIISTKTGRVITKWNIVGRNIAKPFDVIVSADNRVLYLALNASVWKLRIDNPQQIEDAERAESGSVVQDGQNVYSEIRIIKASEDDSSMQTAFIVVIVLGTPVLLSILAMLIQYIILKLRHRKARLKRNLYSTPRNSGVLCHGCCITRKHYFDSNPGMDKFMIGSADESDESEEELFARKI